MGRFSDEKAFSTLSADAKPLGNHANGMWDGSHRFLLTKLSRSAGLLGLLANGGAF